MGDMERLNTITLSNFIRISELPETLGSLSSLQKLDLRGCDALVTLPVCLDQWTGMECLMLNDMTSFKELPPNMAVIKNLHKLHIIMCAISKIPESIGVLTNLKQLVMGSCPIVDLPPSIEALTTLHTIMPFTNNDEPPIGSRAFQTLARALPVFRGLEKMHLTMRWDQEKMVIGRSLQAWPLPKLIFNIYTNAPGALWEETFNWNLRDYQQELTLLPEAVQWEDATTLQYWQMQQNKVMAFACGLYKRLGEVSQVSSIDESMLMHITNELLGCQSLKQQWQREQMAQKTVTVS